MPAIAEEIEAAEEEGIHIHCLTTPVKVVGDAGKATGVECVRMELKEFDKSGRRTPYQIQGSEYTMQVDTLIKARDRDPTLCSLGVTGYAYQKEGR